MTAPANNMTRIMISASSFADAAEAMRLIERIIGDGHPTLGGVLVEEATSLAICDLPNQRVVSPSGQVNEAPSRMELGALLDADARAFRTSLGQLAQRMGAQWAFQRAFGDLVQQSLETGGACDILVIAHRKVHPVAGQVVLLSSSTGRSTEISDLSKQLAQRISARQVELVVDEGTPAPEPSQGVHFDGLDAALAHLAKLNAQAVLLDCAHGPVRTGDALRRVIDAARCPVLAFGLASLVPPIEHTTQIPPSP